MSVVERLKNVPKLQERMFYTGFGAVPKEQLEEQLKEGLEKFQLKHDKKFDKDSTRSILHYEQSKDDVNTYYFNSFDLLLKKEGMEETLQQNFRVMYGESYKLGEAYRMLSGGAVKKDFIRIDRDDPDNRLEYSAWTYLDFDNKDKYGNYVIVKDQEYNLEKKVGEYPIKEMLEEASAQKFINALNKGERVPATVATSKGDLEVFVEAKPKADELQFYNNKMEPISLTKSEAEQKEVKNTEPLESPGQEQNVSNPKEAETQHHDVINKQDLQNASQEQKVNGLSEKVQNQKVNSKVVKKIEKPAKAENKSRGARIR
ncbi:MULTISPECIES: hypothetical protein [Sphingobacterium]|uniref:hypothetical protein n=1 Tax=Sphingobacterium TaxID=28453 RepID=UPI0028A6CCF3|nr:hypothetical protein [Sphingobacterium multivorum]